MRSDAADVTVLVADDAPMMRLALTEVLDAEPDLRVVAVAGSADETTRMAELHRPDVAILDLRMPGGGLAAAADLRRVSPDTRIILFTGVVDALSSTDVTRHGLSHYVVKGATNAEIIAAVRDAAGLER